MHTRGQLCVCAGGVASCLHAQEPVCAGLPPREACGRLARPNDAAKQGSHVAGCAAAYTHAGAAAGCVSSNAAEHGSHVARSAPGSHIRERLCASTTAPYARTQEQPCAASPPRQCCQHDSQATRRAAARCPHGDMRAHAGAAVDLRVVSSPRISIVPAGSRINRDHARRGWATETGHPSWGPGTRDKTSCARLLPHDAADSGRPRFARRQVRIHTCERSRLCVVSTAPCPHRRGSHVLLLRRPTTCPGRRDVLAKPNWLINQSSSS